MNGTTLARSLEPEPFLRSLRIVASLAFLSPSFISHGGRIGAAGSGTFDGKLYRTLVVGDVNAVPMRLYVDPQSALIRLAREADGSETFEYRGVPAGRRFHAAVRGVARRPDIRALRRSRAGFVGIPAAARSDAQL